MTAKKVAKSVIRASLDKMLHVCKNCSETASKTIVNVIDLAREDAETNRKNAMLFECVTQ